ncbi:Uncharacterised protein [[Clostridium] sordellii]|uniref:hypothetical protein n=1 Tax=Paraclostridium sordellii TaxID=1505 RepID=UPI0005E85CFD|nr:hypothetical protein [Paeniclostridium sordellii]CEP94822.1 Uncharacterised protein [[Clostridium] sordellii] [Paeniclostridium sordellii]
MNKKVLSLLAVGAITTSMLSGVVANAATGSKNVEVTYNNQSVITDPDNPGAPQWQVAIPSGINFAEDKKTADVSVELQNVDGTSYTGSEINVDVTVASANEYKLKKNSSEVKYEVAYGEKIMSQSEIAVGTLNTSTKKIDGLATLGDKEVATELGTHTDTLTYTVQKQAEM